jgi:hypothetical protein
MPHGPSHAAGEAELREICHIGWCLNGRAIPAITSQRRGRAGRRRGACRVPLSRKICCITSASTCSRESRTTIFGSRRTCLGSAAFNPDSPDEMAFGQLRASNLVVISNSYAGSSSRILTDPTGERRNRQFRQCFRGLRSCRPNPSGESGFNPSIQPGGRSGGFEAMLWLRKGFGFSGTWTVCEQNQLLAFCFQLSQVHKV